MIKDAFKRTCQIGALTKHLAHFWLVFLRLFLGVGEQNCNPGQVNSGKYIDHHKFFKNLVTSAVFITLLIRIYMILLPVEASC